MVFLISSTRFGLWAFRIKTPMLKIENPKLEISKPFPQNKKAL
jgi:hypothetical protein